MAFSISQRTISIGSLGIAVAMVATLISGCGGGGSSSGNNPSSANVSNRDTATVFADPLFPARLAFDHVSFAARTAALPWEWIPIAGQTASCSEGASNMIVVHGRGNGSQPQPADNYISGDTLGLNSAGCSFDTFSGWYGNWTATVSISSGDISSSYFYATGIAYGDFNVNLRRGIVARTSLIDGREIYTINKTPNGIAIEVTSSGELVQDSASNANYPQLNISSMDLKLNAAPGGTLLDSVSGSFSFDSANVTQLSGTVSIDLPVKFTNGGEGAVAGKITIRQSTGTVTVLEFSGTGQGSVKVSNAPNSTASLVEIYNGTVADLITNH